MAASRAWAVEHPPLPSPYFWFSGRITRMESNSLLQQAPEAPVLDQPSTQWYNLKKGVNKQSYSQWKQDQILKPILGKLGKGFFVESGASDGETDSNSLFYELSGWTGLLVEPDPKAYAVLKTKHRRAYVFNGCLSPTGQAETLHFSASPTLGLSAIEGMDDVKQSREYEVKAQPLHKLMEAAGHSTIDFWSLDIEGSESKVLQSTDFSKVEVGVLMIEMNKNGDNNNGIRDVMNKQGFQDIGHSNYDQGILDHIYVNPKYFQKRNMPVPTKNDLEAQYRD